MVGKVIGVIQCRLKSTRLPGKAMLSFGEYTLLELVIQRAKACKVLDEIWVATTTNREDDIIEQVGIRNKVRVFRGSEKNVLERFCDLGRLANADVIVRITADNPFTESSFIEEGVRCLIKHNKEYIAYQEVPYGAGVEIIGFKALLSAEQYASTDYEKEHVTPYIIEHSLKKEYLLPSNETMRRPDIRVTIDTIEDYIKIYNIIQSQAKEENLSLERAIHFIDDFTPNNI